MVSTTDIDTLASLHQQGAALIDVRESHEYVAGHVPGARLIPLGDSLPPRMSRPRGPPSS